MARFAEQPREAISAAHASQSVPVFLRNGRAYRIPSLAVRLVVASESRGNFPWSMHPQPTCIPAADEDRDWSLDATIPSPRQPTFPPTSFLPFLQTDMPEAQRSMLPNVNDNTLRALRKGVGFLGCCVTVVATPPSSHDKLLLQHPNCCWAAD